MADNKYLGKLAEDIASKYLLDMNYKIIERNFKCRCGEIDIIAQDEDYIVFVEVKYRSTIKKGLPRESVNIYKQKRIITVAKYYINLKSLYDTNFRFDVIELLGNINKPEINLIKNAFEL